MKHRLNGLFVGIAICFVAQAGYAQDEEENTSLPSIQRLVEFTDSVALASRMADCNSMTAVLAEIPQSLKEDAATVISKIRDYEVSDDVISTVSGNSLEVAKKSEICPALVEAYREVARLAKNGG